jgi:uncharacterized protein YceH (UPF0502 family)
VDADSVELRVLGSLVEKRRTTPDAYPLSLNALRLACNQATSREPIVDYDEPTIRAALTKLSNRGWVRLASGPSSRAITYRHLMEDALGVTDAELAVLAVMMLRGPQTLAELKTRTERMHRFESVDEVEQTLSGLAERELAVRIPRRPGQKEDRFGQLLGGDGDAEPTARAEPPTLGDPSLDERVRRLEEAVVVLQDALDATSRKADA